MSDWHNVSKKEPCPICHKTDWCNLSNDGAVCICHRVESPYVARSGSGWIHRLRDVEKKVKVRGEGEQWKGKSFFQHQPLTTNRQSPTLDFGRVHRGYEGDAVLVEGLATTLGVDDEALKALDVRFNPFEECWSFPMRDDEGKIVGLRFRELGGSKKWSAKGSKDGLFFGTQMLSHTQNFDRIGVATTVASLPTPQLDSVEVSAPITNHQTPITELVIVEGPSDTAAAMSLGLSVVGRSSCQTGAALLRALIRRVRPQVVTIVADNDAPGIKGAELLAGQLVGCQSPCTDYEPRLPVRVLVVPHPYKDLRAWYLTGGLTPKLFADVASAQRWR